MPRRDETPSGITQRDRVRTDLFVTRDGSMVDASGNLIGLTGEDVRAVQASVSGAGIAPASMLWKGGMTRMSAAVARAAAGGTPPRILVLGDSTVAGAGAGSGVAPRYTDARPKSWPWSPRCCPTAR